MRQLESLGFSFYGVIADVTVSAMGHKRTYAVQKGMSALPRIETAKADFPQKSCLLYPQKRTCGLPSTFRQNPRCRRAPQRRRQPRQEERAALQLGARGRASCYSATLMAFEDFW